MEQEKNKNVIIALLVVIIVILLALVVLFATKTINLKTNKSSNTEANADEINLKNDVNKYTTENLKGAYTFVSEEMTSNTGDKYTASYYLTLYSNGLYEYRMATFAPFGYIGNYVINGNKITLYGIFGTSSGYGINVYEKMQTKEIIINDDGRLIDKPQSMKGLDFDTVYLTKDDTKDVNDNEILDKLYGTAIFNKTTNN